MTMFCQIIRLVRGHPYEM